jgi:hypothetical protein
LLDLLMRSVNNTSLDIQVMSPELLVRTSFLSHMQSVHQLLLAIDILRVMMLIQELDINL